MENTNALGEFLRARRELVRPGEVGINPHGLRRVPGLRREEVATLAGISADYYLRLEQGRDRNPSVQVLEALARVFQLDADATAYLIGLTRDRARGRARPADEKVPVSIRHLLAQMPMPALVQGKYFDVLGANPIATALSPSIAPGVNRLRSAFLDPRERALYRDWPQATAGVVAQLRAAVGADDGDPRFAALVGELSLKSERFRTLWARHDVRRRVSEISRLHHPEVGDLDLYRDKLAVTGTDGQLLVVYHAEPDTDSAHALALLGSLAATSAVEGAATRAPEDH
ncbi:helix-turn-helix transcriptional regulator [Streptomyces sp. NBC_01317]|uniref:helix-turn-helix domain-containing protein n=1 Tax=Streptomyces sp. NBC_01317 TaxID=2903822 RepID=UPI002E11F9FA|nr:helix-turn-helix transcriptional regulator [Streptomyces sp. NBC_01317]